MSNYGIKDSAQMPDNAALYVSRGLLRANHRDPQSQVVVLRVDRALASRWNVIAPDRAVLRGFLSTPLFEHPRSGVRRVAQRKNRKDRDLEPIETQAWDPVRKLEKTLELFRLYREEAQKCGDAGAHLAGCVLLGSALEAALLAMAQCFPEDVRRTIEAHKSKELARPPSEWSLSQLLLLSRDLRWLPSAGPSTDRFNPDKAKIGDYAEVVRAIRNLLHPSIYLRECPDKSISEKHLRFSFEVLDGACTCLAGSLGDAANTMEP